MCPTVACSRIEQECTRHRVVMSVQDNFVSTGMCNYVDTYLIITYLISFESNFPALQDSIFTKSRMEHPFSSSGHKYLITVK